MHAHRAWDCNWGEGRKRAKTAVGCGNRGKKGEVEGSSLAESHPEVEVMSSVAIRGIELVGLVRMGVAHSTSTCCKPMLYVYTCIHNRTQGI